MKKTHFLNRFLSFALCLCMVLSMIPATPLTASAQSDFASAGGSIYEISSAQDLVDFAARVNGGETNANAVLTADIDMSGKSWTPIGADVNKPYAGNFDGDGYTISNLRITTISTSKLDDVPYSFVGMIGYMKGGGVQNLTLNGVVDVTCDFNVSGHTFSGLLVGQMQDSIIYNCKTQGSVKFTVSAVPASLGNLCCASLGGMLGLGQHSIVIGCGNEASVTTAGEYMVAAGGLVGYLSAGYDFPMCLLNSYNTGSVDVYAQNAGGLVGVLTDDAVNNYCSLSSVSNSCADGGVGLLFGSVSNAIIVDEGGDSTSKFTPLIQNNYYLSGGTAIGSAAEDMDTTGYTTAISADDLSGSLADTLNGNIGTVQEIVAGHLGYLKESQWSDLVAKLNGDEVRAMCWAVVNGKPVQSNDGCSYNSNGNCTRCGGEKQPELVGGAYRIGDVNELLWFARYVNNGHADANAVLIADIDMSGKSWKSIASTGIYHSTTIYADKGYTGTFDGDGHSISNLTIQAVSGDPDGTYGLFGTLSGTVRNLRINNFKFTGAGMDTRVGAVVGQMLDGSLVENCAAIVGDINTKVNTTSGVAGGIAGCNYAGIIRGCFQYDYTISAGRDGGIAGDNRGDINANDRKGLIENCATNYGSIQHKDRPGNVSNSLSGMDANRFASGEAVWILNGNSGSGAWGQTLGTDAHPVLGGKTVNQVSNCVTGGMEFSNSNVPEYLYDNGFCTACGAYQPAFGSGTQADPYKIGNAGQLYWFAQQVDNGNVSAWAELTADIVVNTGNLNTCRGFKLNGWRDWNPIGYFNSTSDNANYNGTFDGKGHTINGLYFSGKLGSVGLFAVVDRGGTVKNVGILNSYLYMDSGHYIGAIAGNNVGTISNCYNAATIGAGVDNVGGIAGYNPGTVINCYNTGTISGAACVGGVVGYNGAGTITNCYSAGYVQGVYHVGGVAGGNINSSSPINNCYYDNLKFNGNAVGTNFGGGTVNAMGVTAKVFATGEVTYLLGEAFGQNIDNGQGNQGYPNFTGAPVYQQINCVDEIKYSNTSEFDFHSWNKATCTAPMTCWRCGETEGDTLPHTWVNGHCAYCKAGCEHSWIAATCTVPKTCSICCVTEGETLEHSWIAATCTVPKTCSVCAATQGSTLEHSWIAATCMAPKTCGECGKTEGGLAQHTEFDNDGVCICGYRTAATYSIYSNITYFDDPVDALKMLNRNGVVRLYQDVTVTESMNNTANARLFLHGHTITLADGCTMRMYTAVIDGSDGKGGKSGAIVGNAASGLLYGANLSNITVTNTNPKGYAMGCGGAIGIKIPAEGVSLNGGAADLYVTEDCYYITFPDGDYRGEPIHLASPAPFKLETKDQGTIDPEWFTCDDGFLVCQDMGEETALYVRYDIGALQAEMKRDYACSQVRPVFIIRNGRDVLIEGTDYSVDWMDDVTSPGQKTGRVTGEGDYAGLTLFTYTQEEHSWKTATVDAPKTCTVCGDTERDEKGHSWLAADCDTPMTCADCGETKGDPLDHIWNDATCITPKTCALCGKTEGGVLEHSYHNGFCVGCSAYEAAEAGDDGWYIIRNGGNLFWFAQQVNGGALGSCAVLAADIDLEGREWTPIGNGVTFSGIIDGRGHSVSGMCITGDVDKAGFIGYIENGGVKDLSISGHIYVNDILYGGMFFGHAKDSVLYNCTASGSIIVSGYFSDNNLADCYGGMAGIINHSVLLNCASSVDLSVTHGTGRANVYVGGIVGYLTVDGSNVPTCLLNSCCTGDISVNGCESLGYIGGLAGYIYDDAVNNYFLGSVQYSGSGAPYWGNAFGGVNIVRENEQPTTVMQKNYILEDTQAYGSGGNEDIYEYFTQDQFSNGEMVAMLNENLALVDELVVGHKGFLSDSEWRDLFVKFGGDDALAAHWIEKDGVAVHCDGSNEACPNCCDHQWLDATCSAPMTCALCGRMKGMKADHAAPVPVNSGSTHTMDRPCCDEADVAGLAHEYVDHYCVCGASESDAVAYIEQNGKRTYYGRLEDGIAAANAITQYGEVNAGIEVVLIKDTQVPNYRNNSANYDKYATLFSGAKLVVDSGVTLTVIAMDFCDSVENNGTITGVDDGGYVFFYENQFGEESGITGNGQWLVGVSLRYATVYSGHFRALYIYDSDNTQILYTDETPITGTVYDYTSLDSSTVMINGESHTHTYGEVQYQYENNREHYVYTPCTTCPFTWYNIVAERHSYNEQGMCVCGKADSFSLTVLDRQIDVTNREDVFGDGTVRYEPETNTLVLNNFHVEDGYISSREGEFGMVISASEKSLNIRLIGDNYISARNIRGMSCPIMCGENLVISGDGTLTVECKEAEELSTPIYCGGYFYVDEGATVTANKMVLCNEHVIFGDFNGISYTDEYEDYLVDGNAVLESDLTVQGKAYNGATTGAVFNIAEDAVLTIPDGVTLTIAQEAAEGLTNRLINNGKIILEGTGTIVNEGEAVCTETAEHCFIHNKVCIICGETNPDYVPVILTPKSFTLSFEDEILVNLYYTVSDMTEVVEQGVLVFYNEGEFTIENADRVYIGAVYDPVKDRYMSSTEGIAAKEMGDSRYYVAYAKLIDGSYVYTEAKAYSPKQYAMNMLGKSTTSDTQKALCVAMLNYGAAAQSYFGHNTDDLMNANLTAEQKAMVRGYDSSLFTSAVAADEEKLGIFTKSTTGFKKKTATVSFEGAFVINYYFTPDVEVNGNMTFLYWTPEAYANADTLTFGNASGYCVMVEKDGVYFAQVTGIPAKALDETYYVVGAYTDEAGNEYCTGIIAYSLSKYCINNANGSMGELAKATAMYGYYADLHLNK